ncbi:putative reverse transcriptase domain-containing protein [Tanacetum coccineum]
MDEAHAMRYFVHPGADKMYHDLRYTYWWPGMKKDIATYASKLLESNLNSWKALVEPIGTCVTNTSKTDGQSEHTVLTLEDMLGADVEEVNDLSRDRSKRPFL